VIAFGPASLTKLVESQKAFTNQPLLA
jgi:hypothetical protein